MMAYADLQVTSNFSFLRGGSHPEELVLRAAGQHRRQPKAVRARMAAQLILQSYMDYQHIQANRRRSEAAEDI